MLLVAGYFALGDYYEEYLKFNPRSNEMRVYIIKNKGACARLPDILG